MTATRAAGPTITIDAASPSGKVSPLFYGLMTEEINHAYDGGLYAELVRNRAFLDDARHRRTGRSCRATAPRPMALDPKEPLNATIGTSLRFNVTQASTGHAAGVANEGYWGIPVKPNTRYRASFYAKAAPGFTGPIAVSIQSDDGRTIYATKTVTGLTPAWKQYEVTLQTGKVTPTTKARYVLTVDRPGTVWFSLVSLFPPTFKNQPNGFRPDLMQMMVDMKPKFLRFPGGNYLEGDQIADRFEWKKTLGPLADRPGHMAPWGYRSTRRDGPARVPALVRGHERRAPAGGVRGLLAQGRARESGPGSRTIRAGRARRDRVCHGPGHVQMGIAAGEGRPSGAVHN